MVIFDVRYDTRIYVLQGHQDCITGLAFSASGALLVSSSADAKVCIWGQVRPARSPLASGRRWGRRLPFPRLSPNPGFFRWCSSIYGPPWKASPQDGCSGHACC